MAQAKTKQPEINDLIFKELIKRGYSLEGNTRVWNIADSKLWYLTPEQAQAFLDLEKDVDYQRDVIQKETDLINENIEDFLEKLKDEPLNIIDLGCGDGKKAEIFVKHLKGNIKLRYCPVDISGYMVNKAMQRLKKLGAGEVVNFQWNISDFENIENIAGLLRREDYKKNLFLLLGNTLGNFEINELLYEIRSAMKEGDFLFIGNGLDTKKKGNIMKSYLNTDVDNFLKHIPAQLGLDKKDVEFGVRFQNSRIEVYYTIIEDKEIAFQDKKVQFNKGDQIIAAVSYKYDKHDFTAYLRMYFDFVKLISSKDDSYAVALCKK